MQDTTDHKSLADAKRRAQLEEFRRMAAVAAAVSRMGQLLSPDAFAPRPTGWDDLYRNGASALERA